MGKIAVLGSLNMDTCCRVAHIPAPGETIMAKSFEKNPGGKGGNQAVAAAKMGADVVMIGCVGADGDGEALRRSLQAAGVCTDGMENCGEPTGSAFICVSDDAENNIVVHAGANACVDAGVLDRQKQSMMSAQICAMQLEIPHETVWEALRRCKVSGVTTVLNPSPVCEIPEEALRGLDVLVPNEMEMAALLGHEVSEDADELSRYAQEKGIRCILMTRGEAGCDVVTAQGVRHFSCEPVKAVDTTGAGDTFLGAFCAMIAENRPIEEAIAVAQRAAGWTVRHMGAQQAMPFRSDIL